MIIRFLNQISRNLSSVSISESTIIGQIFFVDLQNL